MIFHSRPTLSPLWTFPALSSIALFRIAVSSTFSWSPFLPAFAPRGTRRRRHRRRLPAPRPPHPRRRYSSSGSFAPGLRLLRRPGLRLRKSDPG